MCSFVITAQRCESAWSSNRLSVLGDAMLVEPDVLCRLTLLEEQQVGADAGVGFEDAVRQPNDGVEVALLHQMFLEPRLDALAEKRAVRQHNGGAAAGLQQANDEREEKIGCLSCLKVFGEVGLDAVFLAASKGRIGEHDIHAVAGRVTDIGSRESVVVADEAGILDAVQQHVGDAEHVRKLLLLHGAQGLPACAARLQASSHSACACGAARR